MVIADCLVYMCPSRCRFQALSVAATCGLCAESSAAAAGGVWATLPIQAKSCCSSLVGCRTWQQNCSR